MYTYDPTHGIHYHGIDEGDRCGVLGCDGVIVLPKVENCTCFKNAPCSACTSNDYTCNECYNTPLLLQTDAIRFYQTMRRDQLEGTDLVINIALDDALVEAIIVHVLRYYPDSPALMEPTIVYLEQNGYPHVRDKLVEIRLQR